MQKLIINPELKAFQPNTKSRPTAAMLESYIKSHGAICPVLVWNDTIIDGHRSYKLYRKHKIPFKVFQADFKSLEDAQCWIYENLMNDEQRKQRERPNPPERSTNPVPQSYWQARRSKMRSKTMIPLDRIRIDCNTQARVQIDPELVREYADAMRRGECFEPIRVFQETEVSDYVLIDGFHRYEAHKEVYPDLLIAAEVEDGNIEDARWASFGVNAGHGAKRSKEDLHKSIREALLHPYGQGLSNYLIAEHVKTSESTVRRIRDEMKPTTSMTQSTERVGRDGRVIRTAKIGKTKDGTKPSVEKVKIVDCSQPLLPDIDPKNEAILENLIASLSNESVTETAKVFFQQIHKRFGKAATKSLATELFEQYGR